MKQLIEIKQLEPVLYLTWIINNICTNKCSYCPPITHNGTNHHYEWSHAEQFIKLLLTKYPRINVAISGGEPTVSPWFRDLVKLFFDNGHAVGMTTNGARSVRYFDDIAQYMSYIVFSYHPSFEDPTLIDKALVSAKHTPTCISVMMDSRHFDKSVEMYHKLCEYEQLTVEPVRITPWIKSTVGCDYTEEQIKILTSLQSKKATKGVSPKIKSRIGGTFYYEDGTVDERGDAQDIINKKLTNFQGWQCNIGLESLFVYFNGIIRTGNCNSSLRIGSLLDIDNIQWPSEAVTCPQTFCHCTTDVYVSKRK